MQIHASGALSDSPSAWLKAFMSLMLLWGNQPHLYKAETDFAYYCSVFLYRWRYFRGICLEGVNPFRLKLILESVRDTYVHRFPLAVIGKQEKKNVPLKHEFLCGILAPSFSCLHGLPTLEILYNNWCIVWMEVSKARIVLNCLDAQGIWTQSH